MKNEKLMILGSVAHTYKDDEELLMPMSPEGVEKSDVELEFDKNDMLVPFEQRAEEFRQKIAQMQKENKPENKPNKSQAEIDDLLPPMGITFDK